MGSELHFDDRWAWKVIRKRFSLLKTASFHPLFLILGLFLVVLFSSPVFAQSDVPVISGAFGFQYSKDDGQPSLQPILYPVVLVPLGSHFLVEAAAELQGFIAPSTPNGPYTGQFFPGISYLQLDYVLNSHLTIVAGRFYTPFNIYDERLGPIWIHNFQDGPLIFPIGTRTTGDSDGGMIRGDLISQSGYVVNYTAFFSALSNSTYFGAGRAVGVRGGVFFTKQRLEIGTSFERFLQDERSNSYGAYLSWQPPKTNLDIKGEYAHSPQGQGYWLEAAYRLSESGRFGSELKNLQPLFRMQQFFRLAPGTNDSLPAADTQRVDFGLNYYLSHEVRLNASYGRQFSSTGNSNNWTVDITYRFLTPLPFWPKGAS
jgi:hypothetical protein